jgi:hypothetical protein
MGEENERKKEEKKNVLIMWEKKVKQNLVSGLLSENVSSNLVSKSIPSSLTKIVF